WLQSRVGAGSTCQFTLPIEGGAPPTTGCPSVLARSLVQRGVWVLGLAMAGFGRLLREQDECEQGERPEDDRRDRPWPGAAAVGRCQTVGVDRAHDPDHGAQDEEPSTEQKTRHRTSTSHT